MYIQNFCFQVWPHFSKALLDDKLCKECLFPQPNWLALKKKKKTKTKKNKTDETGETDETDEPETRRISDADLARITTRGDEYDKQTYEHFVEYTDAITYIHPTRCQTMNSLSRTLNNEEVTVNLTEHPGTSKPFD